MGAEEIHYKRSRFATRLFPDRLYTAGHSWIRREEGDLWRVGFTKFAVRMLGEAVEMAFEVQTGAAVKTGQPIGWIEGFKAVTDLYAPFAGTFGGANPALQKEIGLVQTDPAGRGWLYSLRGAPGGDCLDAQGYVAVLDATIDKMLGKRHDEA
ncbi:MAG TPA: glycine cleavage system protein H [Planctomycetota bacterium]|jgi:glycine cleavage system H protein|nr:glycine cleavage system protein H [Planctomycetota bacterium]